MKFIIRYSLLFFVSFNLIAEETEALQPKLVTADEEVCPISDKKPDKLILANDSETPLVDLSRELKDFSTDFVVKEFFRSKETLFNFMRIVYETIDGDLKKYREDNNLDDRSITFLFKGGNVLRLIANGVFSLLPPEARDLLKSGYPDIFKRSDADYTVIVDENRLKGLDYDKVMDELTLLTYHSLNKIRDEFTVNPEKYFDFTQLKSRLAQNIIAKYFDRLKDLAAVSDEDNTNWFKAVFTQLQLLRERAHRKPFCVYEGQYDYLYEIDPTDKDKIIGTPLSKSSSWIMNTINRTLSWPTTRDPDAMVAFHLVRSKIQFEYSFIKDGEARRKPIGGELIDVSFPLRTDFRIKEFIKNYDDWIANYTLKLSDDEVLNFKAESIRGITDDLWGVLFGQNVRPWDDAKYKKRMNRLFFLSIAEMMSTWGLGNENITTYVDQIRDKFVTPLRGLYPIDKEKSKALLDDVKQTVDAIAVNAEAMSAANDVFRGIVAMASDALVNDPKEDDEAQLKELLDTIDANLDILLKLAKMQPRTIELEEVYQAPIENLL